MHICEISGCLHLLCAVSDHGERWAPEDFQTPEQERIVGKRAGAANAYTWVWRRRCPAVHDCLYVSLPVRELRRAIESLLSTLDSYWRFCRIYYAS
ncbi:hypothetical protein ACLKA6_015896 [Drosophila palustris]